jgi:S-adenosylmethionine hydrolase
MAGPLITLLTDFGAGSGYPAQMKGVILSLCPEARLVDLSHEVPAFQLTLGQLLLKDAAAVYPPGTIHLAVVDPGVGTARRALVVADGERAPGQLFVGPDNGLLWPFMRGARVHELTAAHLRRPTVSPTFHGRDVFAPAAAHLALGIPPEQFGPAVADPVKLSPPRVRREGGAIVGEVVFVDHFGNLVSNLDAEDLPPVDHSQLKVMVGGKTLLPLRSTYGDVPQGQLVAVIGSSGLLEIAQREGSAARALGLEDPRGMPVVVEPL